MTDLESIRPEQDPGLRYLEEAADLLRKASIDNERRGREAAKMHSGQQEEAARILAEVRAERLRIAEALISCAAVARGEVTSLSRSYELPHAGSGNPETS